VEKKLFVENGAKQNAVCFVAVQLNLFRKCHETFTQEKRKETQPRRISTAAEIENHGDQIFCVVLEVHEKMSAATNLQSSSAFTSPFLLSGMAFVFVLDGACDSDDEKMARETALTLLQIRKFSTLELEPRMWNCTEESIM
jgi:hypothetical protein